MIMAGATFISCSNSKDARDVVAGAVDEMRTKGQSVFMFPEGTRSYSKEPMLLPFKKRAFHLAVQGQVPIVPVVVANYSHILWIKGPVFRSGKIPIKGEYFRLVKLGAMFIDRLVPQPWTLFPPLALQPPTLTD